MNSSLYWVTPFNYMAEVNEGLSIPKKVQIQDHTLRETEQSPHIVLTTEEKLRLARVLDDLGVYSIQMFPRLSEEDLECTKAMRKMNLQSQAVCCLTRYRNDDIDVALECGADRSSSRALPTLP